MVASQKPVLTYAKKEKAPVNWLQLIEAESPRFHCPVVGTELSGPCNVHNCILWTSAAKSYNCAGVFSSMKAANSEERLQSASASQRERKGTLRAAANGKLSFYDMAYLYGFSRQRVEGYVSYGRQIIDVLAPLVASVEYESPPRATKRLGSPTLFTHTNPVAHLDEESGDITRVCICCETVIEPDDDELVIALLDRAEVAWCSRECAREFPIDGYLVANRYKRHFASVALGKDPVDERSRVREITPDRMAVLKGLAEKQGYA